MGPVQSIEDIARILHLSKGGDIAENPSEELIKQAERIYEKYEVRPLMRATSKEFNDAVKRGFYGE